MKRTLPAAARLIKYVAKANALAGVKQPWFVCTWCNALTLGEGTEIDVSDAPTWNGEWVFCARCVSYCDVCEEEYAPMLAYRHEDCAEEAESSSSSSSDDRPLPVSSVE